MNYLPSLVLTAALFTSCRTVNRPGMEKAHVTTIDGDTVDLDSGMRVRLICIDTPEKGKPYYKVAKQF